MTLTNDDIEELCAILRYYHRIEFQLITDYEKVVANREEITSEVENSGEDTVIEFTSVYSYPCPCQIIYLNEDNYAISYKKQHIIESDNEENEYDYYYDFNPDIDSIDGIFTYINPLEWKRTESTEDWMDFAEE